MARMTWCRVIGRAAVRLALGLLAVFTGSAVGQSEAGDCGGFHATRLAEVGAESRPFRVVADESAAVTLTGRFKNHPYAWPVLRPLGDADAAKLSVALRRGARLAKAAATERAKLHEKLWDARIARFANESSSAMLFAVADEKGEGHLRLDLSTHAYLPNTDVIWSADSRFDSLVIALSEAEAFAKALDARGAASKAAAKAKADNDAKVARAKQAADAAPAKPKPASMPAASPTSRPKPKATHAIATADRLLTPLRRDASASASVVATAAHGTSVRLLAERSVDGETWAYVEAQIGGGAASGWLPKALLVPVGR